MVAEHPKRRLSPGAPGNRVRPGGKIPEVRGQRSEIVRIDSATELEVYKKAYQLAMIIYELSSGFPPEEKYALTSQIRRSSRSISMNLREAWAKRRYEAHFVSKLTDSDGENAETGTSLDFARDCGYITDEQHEKLAGLCAEIGRMLGAMLRNPAPFLIHQPRSTSPER